MTGVQTCALPIFLCVCFLTLTHGAALPRHGDGVEAAVSAGGRHAAGVAAHALAERAVVLTPMVAVRQDLPVHVATGEVQHGVHGVWRDREGETETIREGRDYMRRGEHSD